MNCHPKCECCRLNCLGGPIGWLGKVCAFFVDYVCHYRCPCCYEKGHTGYIRPPYPR